MDNSTEGVTLFTGFLYDLLQCYEGLEESFSDLFAMAAPYPPDDPTKPVPMQVYNNMCDWIEARVGRSSIVRAGEAIGNRAYGQMTADGGLGANPTPAVIMEQLVRVASLMIQDPRGRGWEISSSEPGSIVMRRTQTFNCMLQEGLLASLLKRTGVTLPMSKHVECTRKGAPYCEYRLTWVP